MPAGRSPPSPVPVQGAPPPGRNAGRHDAQAARERGGWPLRGHRTRSASGESPPGASVSSEIDRYVASIGTVVKGIVSAKGTIFSAVRIFRQQTRQWLFGLQQTRQCEPGRQQTRQWPRGVQWTMQSVRAWSSTVSAPAATHSTARQSTPARNPERFRQIVVVDPVAGFRLHQHRARGGVGFLDKDRRPAESQMFMVATPNRPPRPALPRLRPLRQERRIVRASRPPRLALLRCAARIQAERRRRRFEAQASTDTARRRPRPRPAGSGPLGRRGRMCGTASPPRRGRNALQQAEREGFMDAVADEVDRGRGCGGDFERAIAWRHGIHKGHRKPCVIGCDGGGDVRRFPGRSCKAAA